MSDHITVIGNVAATPELRRTGAGDPVTSFRVGSTSRRRDAQTGQWVDGETNWYRVSAFRGLGEHAFASVTKGQRVIVVGRLRVRRWESAGKSGTDVEIDAEAIGHDLLFGTSAFSRASAASPHQVASEADPAGSRDGRESGGTPDSSAAVVDADGWAVAVSGDVPF